MHELVKMRFVLDILDTDKAVAFYSDFTKNQDKYAKEKKILYI